MAVVPKRMVRWLYDHSMTAIERLTYTKVETATIQPMCLNPVECASIFTLGLVGVEVTSVGTTRFPLQVRMEKEDYVTSPRRFLLSRRVHARNKVPAPVQKEKEKRKRHSVRPLSLSLSLALSNLPPVAALNPTTQTWSTPEQTAANKKQY